MKTVIEMAREAGILATFNTLHPSIEIFAALVRADEREKYKWDVHSCGPTCKRYACVAMREAVEAEREACAKVCEELVPDMSRTANDASVWDVATFDCAAAIRARGSNT